MAKMLDRATGLGAVPSAAFEEQRARWEQRLRAGSGRSGPGSGAVDRTISDIPLKALMDPKTSRTWISPVI